MQYLVGLTGLIGSGKSMAEMVFKELGIGVIDTDLIAHQVTASNGIAIPEIIKQFGPEFVNTSGELNRVKMRELVFASPDSLHRLEKILHPLIFLAVLQQIKRQNSSYVIIMVPLLFKSIKYLSLIHRSIFMDCDESILIQRVIKRSSMTVGDVKAILKTQMPRSLQLNLSDDHLHNNGTILELNKQIIKLHNHYLELFTKVQE